MFISLLETSVVFVVEQGLFAHLRVFSRMLQHTSQILLHSRYHTEYYQVSLLGCRVLHTPRILRGHKHRKARFNANKPLAHSSCCLLSMRRTEIINHHYKQNIYVMFSCDTHQESTEELCGLWGKTQNRKELSPCMKKLRHLPIFKRR